MGLATSRKGAPQLPSSSNTGQPVLHYSNFYPFLPKLRKDPQTKAHGQPE